MLDNKVKAYFTSTPASDLAVLQFVEQFVQVYHVPETLADRVILAISEAATNAMKHGNGYDATKQVEIELSVKDDKLEVWAIVEDEGAGFDPDALPNPLDTENLLKASGRGVFLIRNLADEVHFEEQGTRTRMCFKQQ